MVAFTSLLSERGPSTGPAPQGLPDPALAETGPRPDLLAGLGWQGAQQASRSRGWAWMGASPLPSLADQPPRPAGSLFALALGQGRPRQ